VVLDSATLDLVLVLDSVLVLAVVPVLVADAAWADACVALVLEFVACSQVADAVQTVAATLLLQQIADVTKPGLAFLTRK